VSARYAIFCANPLDPRVAEPGFDLEVSAAREAGFAVVLIDHDELDRRIRPEAALRRARLSAPGNAVYRGWMLRSEAYRDLYNALVERGVSLMTSPAAYGACHHTPGSYAALRAWMPETAWVEEDRLDDPSAIRTVLAPFGSSAVVIKDWVKSQAAGYWVEACFIPDASDLDHANRVISRFRELQGESLVGGVVFKAYLPLVPEGGRADEYRAFLVGGQPVGCWPRSEKASRHEPPLAELLKDVASRVPSPFASADFGVDDRGRWWLLEVGDGQVSALPDARAAIPLFKALARACAEAPLPEAPT
jgi:hypothetical protein